MDERHGQQRDARRQPLQQLRMREEGPAESQGTHFQRQMQRMEFVRQHQEREAKQWAAPPRAAQAQPAAARVSHAQQRVVAHRRDRQERETKRWSVVQAPAHGRPGADRVRHYQQKILAHRPDVRARRDMRARDDARNRRDARGRQHDARNRWATRFAHGERRWWQKKAQAPTPPPAPTPAAKPLGATKNVSTTLTELPTPIAVTATVVAAVASVAAQAQEAKSDVPDGMMRIGGPVAEKGKKQSDKDDKDDKDASDRPQPTPKGTGRLAGRVLAPILGTFDPKVILAPHLAPALLPQLALRYERVERGQAPWITRLTLKADQAVETEIPILEAKFPEQAFGPNYKYVPYRSAEGPAPGIRSATECDAARCYGAPAIGWKDEKHATCAKGVKIGIIDTGIDPTHRALARLNLSWRRNPHDMAKPSPTWHGTGVTALLAGARGTGTPGLVPDAQFAVRDAFFSNDKEQAETDTDRLLWALGELGEWGAHIVNMSFVGPPDPILHQRIIEMSKKGVVFIAAAGNSGLGAPPAYPAAYSNEVIAVTAVDREGRNYADANQGKYIDVAAPGVRIWTALPGNREGALSGTSFAAPFVTAIAAAIYNSTPLRAVHDGKAPSINPKQAMLARFSIDKVAGGGRDPIFGLGYAKAPDTCAPPAQAAPPALVEQAPAVRPAFAAARRAPASARADVSTHDWGLATKVERAGLRPTN